MLRRAGQRASPDTPSTVTDGDLRANASRRVATLAGRQLSLTAREFDLLRFLVRHPGAAFSRDQLLRDVWGWSFGDQSTVTVHVRRLREKVEPAPGPAGHRLGRGLPLGEVRMSDQSAVVLISVAWPGAVGAAGLLVA